MNHHADEPLYSEISTETPEKIQNTPVVFSPDAPEVPKAFSKLFSYRIDEIFAHYLENGIPLGETLLDLFSVCHVGRIVHRVQKCVRSIEIWSFLRLLEWIQFWNHFSAKFSQHVPICLIVTYKYKSIKFIDFINFPQFLALSSNHHKFNI